MAKTELTLQIEQALLNWNPDKLAGCRINRLRKGFAAYEVPVISGHTENGIIDFVAVYECFENEKVHYGCSLLEQMDDDGLPSYALERAESVRCSNIESLRKGEMRDCSNPRCVWKKTRREHDESILVVAIEIKVSKSDFKSKHGHNFVADANYYAMPSWLYHQVRTLIPEGVGVLLFYDGNTIESIHQNTAVKYYGIRLKRDAALRPMELGDKLWLLMSTAKRALKRKDALFDELLKEGLKGEQFML